MEVVRGPDYDRGSVQFLYGNLTFLMQRSRHGFEDCQLKHSSHLEFDEQSGNHRMLLCQNCCVRIGIRELFRRLWCRESCVGKVTEVQPALVFERVHMCGGFNGVL